MQFETRLDPRDIAGSPAIAQTRKRAASDQAESAGPREDKSDDKRGKDGLGLQPLGKTLRPLVKPFLRKRSPLEASLLLDWDQAVGAELASLCRPLKLRRERRADAQVGALELACLSWAALELQHRAPQVIERVNAFLGVSAIQRLRIRQVAQLSPSLPSGLQGSKASRGPSVGAANRRRGRQDSEDEGSAPDLPSSGHEELDRAFARLAGTIRSRGDHEDAT